MQTRPVRIVRAVVAMVFVVWERIPAAVPWIAQGFAVEMDFATRRSPAVSAQKIAGIVLEHAVRATPAPVVAIWM